MDLDSDEFIKSLRASSSSMASLPKPLQALILFVDLPFHASSSVIYSNFTSFGKNVTFYEYFWPFVFLKLQKFLINPTTDCFNSLLIYVSFPLACSWFSCWQTHWQAHCTQSINEWLPSVEWMHECIDNEWMH